MSFRIREALSAGIRPRQDRRGRQGRHARGRLLGTELLEDRALLTASLTSIPSLSVPALLGYQLPLDGSGSSDANQTFVASSDNPNIRVSVAQGLYWTIGISHQPSAVNDVTMTDEKLTFQLFQDLTPATTARITNLVNLGFYTQGITGSTPAGPGQYIPRITQVNSSGFGVVQGGSTMPDGTSSRSGLTPIATEPVQQLAFTGLYQLAMANTGAANSTDAQFFVNYDLYSQSIQQQFDFKYTIFGQLVSGRQTMIDLSKILTVSNSGGENSRPASPVLITSSSLSASNTSGVLHIDTTSARAGDTANVTVTAIAPDGTQAARSFVVGVSAYNGPTTPVINFVPLSNAVTASTVASSSVSVKLQGQASPPGTSGARLSYSITVQPKHGTISQFDATTGNLVYTPDPGFTGSDAFQYVVQASGPQTVAAPATSLPSPVTISILAPTTQPPTTTPPTNTPPPATPPTSTETTTTPPPTEPESPLVTVIGVEQVLNRKKQVTQILVHFSGPVSVGTATQVRNYRLALPGSKGSYTARNAPIVRLLSATYDSGTHTVRLQVRTPVASGKRSQLKISGGAAGLTDGQGRLIDGDHDTIAGGDAVAYLSRSGATVAIRR